MSRNQKTIPDSHEVQRQIWQVQCAVFSRNFEDVSHGRRYPLPGWRSTEGNRRQSCSWVQASFSYPYSAPSWILWFSSYAVDRSGNCGYLVGKLNWSDSPSIKTCALWGRRYVDWTTKLWLILNSHIIRIRGVWRSCRMLLWAFFRWFSACVFGCRIIWIEYCRSTVQAPRLMCCLALLRRNGSKWERRIVRSQTPQRWLCGYDGRLSTLWVRGGVGKDWGFCCVGAYEHFRIITPFMRYR